MKQNAATGSVSLPSLPNAIPATKDRRPRNSLKRRLFDALPQRRREKIRRLWMRVSPLREAMRGNMDQFYVQSQAQRFFHNAFKALRFNGIQGDYVEFGSWSGFTFGLAYHQSRSVGYPCKLWSFDSFAGLPPVTSSIDQHPKWREGSMSMSQETFHLICNYNAIPRSAYEVVPGYYEDSLSDSSRPHPESVSFAYIDCDMYSSSVIALRYLLRFVKHGTILAFDDWHCWSATQPAGERKACYEVLLDHPDWRLIPFQQFGWGGMSFVLESKKMEGTVNLPSGAAW